jgi:hypothetical protein
VRVADADVERDTDKVADTVSAGDREGSGDKDGAKEGVAGADSEGVSCAVAVRLVDGDPESEPEAEAVADPIPLWETLEDEDGDRLVVVVREAVVDALGDRLVVVVLELVAVAVIVFDVVKVTLAEAVEEADEDAEAVED